MEANLLGSAAYFSSRGGGTNLGFLAALYEDVLGRPLDAVGALDWGQLLAEGVSPAAVAAAVLTSPEADQDEVEGLYQRYLHRPADPGGLLAATELLQRGVSDEVLLLLVLGSPEYYQDAQ